MRTSAARTSSSSEARGSRGCIARDGGMRRRTAAVRATSSCPGGPRHGKPAEAGEEFNQQSKDFKVTYQEMPVDTGQYFDKLRIQFQAGGGDKTSDSGDVTEKPSSRSTVGSLDLSDRFKDTDEFLTFLCRPRPTTARSGPFRGTRTPGSCTTGRISWRNPATRAPRNLDRAAGDGRQGNEGPEHRQRLRLPGGRGPGRG